MASLADVLVRQLLDGRYIASLATENPDRSIHMVAVKYWFDRTHVFVATSSRSRKARTPGGISKSAGSRDPSSSCVTRVSLFESVCFLVPSGSVYMPFEVTRESRANPISGSPILTNSGFSIGCVSLTRARYPRACLPAGQFRSHDSRRLRSMYHASVTDSCGSELGAFERNLLSSRHDVSRDVPEDLLALARV